MVSKFAELKERAEKKGLWLVHCPSSSSYLLICAKSHDLFHEKAMSLYDIETLLDGLNVTQNDSEETPWMS